MADRKISDLTALTTPATGDLIPIVDISEAAAADKNKSITVGELLRGAPDGTAAAPGFAFESDGGNGMFLGGTDILAFSTGGTQAVTIDASQRLGIGTSTVDAGVKVQIEDASPALRIKHNSNGVNDTLGSVQFGSSSEANCAAIYALHDGNNTAGKLSFRTEASGGNLEERLVIDSSGRVGIGTTSPVTPLDVVGGAIAVSGGLPSDLTNRLVLENSSNLSTITSYGATSGTGALRFITGGGGGSSGAEAARIDSSGRLLVGLTSTSASSTLILQDNSASSGPAVLRMASAAATPSDGISLGIINFSDNTHTASGQLYAQRDGGTWSASSKPTRLVFSTTADGASAPTERMRISENGRVRFFSSDEGIQSNVAGSSKNLFTCTNNSTSTTTGTLKFVVRADGDCENTNNSYGGISDIKLKENIVDASSQWDDLKAIQVRNYNFKEETGHQTHTQLGVIAQEIELVSPGLVSESPDLDEEGNDLGTVTKSVNYSVLYMKAVKALQEAMERIETLEAKVAALEAQ